MNILWTIIFANIFRNCIGWNGKNESQVTLTESAEDVKEILFESIEQFCQLIGIPVTNCSCELFKYDVESQFPSLCELDREMNKTTLQLIYSSIHSKTYASVTTVASLAGIVGNAAVLGVAYQEKKSLSTCKTIFAQLALTDLIFAILQIIVVIPLYWTNKWLYGLVFCKVFRSGITLSCLLNIGFILIITVERFCGIVYPLRKRVSSKQTLPFLTIANVVAGMATVLPMGMVLRLDEETGRCEEKWSTTSHSSLIYAWFLLVFYAIIPVLIIMILYTFIIFRLKKDEKLNATLYQESQREKKLISNRRIMWIIFAIVIAFVICIFPNRIIWVYFEHKSFNVNDNVYIILSYLGYLTYPFHVTFNPIIYSVIDRKWRQDIIGALTCKKTQRRDSAVSYLTATSISSPEVNRTMVTSKKEMRTVEMLEVENDSLMSSINDDTQM